MARFTLSRVCTVAAWTSFCVTLEHYYEAAPHPTAILRSMAAPGLLAGATPEVYR